jgi:hypothetical protein
LRGVSKDGCTRACGHPSRLAVKNGEHLRMTAIANYKTWHIQFQRFRRGALRHGEFVVASRNPFKEK